MSPFPVLAAIAAFLAIVMLAYAISAILGEERRLVVDRVQRHGGTATAPPAETTGSSAALLLGKEYSSFESFDKMLKRSGYAERTAAELTRAAVPLRVGEYLLIRWLSAVGLYFVGASLLHLHVVVSVLLGVAGFFLPRFYVRRKESQRIRKFNDQLVDALSMMANSLKSGSSFLQAIDMVAHELPPPVCQEFARVVAEANVGASVENSLLDLAQRVRSYDLYLIVTAMLVQREVGGNLSEVLENIAHTIRERQRILRQVQVETAEVRLSGYVVGALPVFMLIMLTFISPAYASVLTTGFGQVILLGAGLAEILGFLVIRRIVDIQV